MTPRFGCAPVRDAYFDWRSPVQIEEENKVWWENAKKYVKNDSRFFYCQFLTCKKELFCVRLEWFCEGFYETTLRNNHYYLSDRDFITKMKQTISENNGWLTHPEENKMNDIVEANKAFIGQLNSLLKGGNSTVQISYSIHAHFGSPLLENAIIHCTVDNTTYQECVPLQSTMLPLRMLDFCTKHKLIGQAKSTSLEASQRAFWKQMEPLYKESTLVGYSNWEHGIDLTPQSLFSFSRIDFRMENANQCIAKHYIDHHVKKQPKEEVKDSAFIAIAKKYEDEQDCSDIEMVEDLMISMMRNH